MCGVRVDASGGDGKEFFCWHVHDIAPCSHGKLRTGTGTNMAQFLKKAPDLNGVSGESPRFPEIPPNSNLADCPWAG